MIYRKKVFILAAAAFVLILIYAASFIFDDQLNINRQTVFSWITGDVKDRANIIEISGISGPVILQRINNIWVMPVYMGEDSPEPLRYFPVRQSRVDDLFSALSKKKSYPIRTRAGNSSLQRLGLLEGTASRITIRGGAGWPLLDMMIGFGEAAGSTVYLRKSGETNARSGEDIFSAFTETGRNSWLDLGLFGSIRDNQEISIETIQRVLVYPPDRLDIRTLEQVLLPSFMLTRNNREWNYSTSQIDAGSFTVSPVKAESWLRTIINAEAQSFAFHLTGIDNLFNRGNITLELGDGSVIIIRFGPEDNDLCRNVTISGNDFVYTLNERTLLAFFPELSYWTADTDIRY